MDYTLNGNHTLQPPPGGGAPTDEHCLPVFQLCQDDVPEDDETLTVAISSTNPLVSLLQNNFTVTIIDDDSKKQRKAIYYCRKDIVEPL